MVITRYSFGKVEYSLKALLWIVMCSCLVFALKRICLDNDDHEGMQKVRQQSNNDILVMDIKRIMSKHMVTAKGKYEKRIFQANSVRKNACTNCFSQNYSFTIENDHICDQRRTQVIEIIFVILTSHSRFYHRDAQRRSWLTHSKNNTANVRYIFLLGAKNDTDLQNSVLNENRVYNDIIQADFMDSFHNLTIKTIMGYNWAVNNCKHARFVMKVDDDTYINVPHVVNFVRKNYHMLQSTLAGGCRMDAAPIRNVSSPYYISKTSYPGRSYPGFCYGAGHITSLKVASEIIQVSKDIPFFQLEDVYVSLCIKKLGYRLKNVKGFYATCVIPKDNADYMTKRIYMTHHITPVSMIKIWTGQTLIDSRCDKLEN